MLVVRDRVFVDSSASLSVSHEKEEERVRLHHYACVDETKSVIWMPYQYCCFQRLSVSYADFGCHLSVIHCAR